MSFIGRLRAACTPHGASASSKLPLTQLCENPSSTHDTISEALERGDMADAQTLIAACNRALAVQQKGNPSAPGEENDLAAAELAGWEEVAIRIVKQGVTPTPEALKLGSQMGRGLDVRMKFAQQERL